jgi:hypothetical protein
VRSVSVCLCRGRLPIQLRADPNAAAICRRPRPDLLLACHAFNEVAQLNQLRRGYAYQQKRHEETGQAVELNLSQVGVALATGAVLTVTGPAIQRAITSSGAVPQGVKMLAEHPAGPFTSQFWAPTAKWSLSVANIMDINRPVEKVSTAQQTALCATGFIWTRYALVITPVNYNLCAVNLVLAATGASVPGRACVAD